MRLSVVLPTRGQPVLANALSSLSQLGADDELVLLIDGDPADAFRILRGATVPCRVTTIVQTPSPGDMGNSLRDA
jgi:hypothetical protein